MGYTHYWRNHTPISYQDWDAICADVAIMIGASPVKVQAEYNRREPAIIDADKIIFNGIGDHGHETFFLTRAPQKFAFCKTAHKPYDALVCACLAVASPYLSKVSSDGAFDVQWEHAIEWASKVLGRKVVVVSEGKQGGA